MSEIIIPKGLVPYHFAGMTYNPDKGRLSSQSQKLLVIAPFEIDEESKSCKEGLQVITSFEDILALYPNKDSTITKMLLASYEQYPMIQRYALASDTLQEALDLLPEIQFTQIASSFNSKEDLILANDFLEKRWGNVLQIDGHYFVSSSGKPSEIVSKYSHDESVLDSLKHITVMASSNSETDPSVWASTLATLNAQYATKPYLPYHSLSFSSQVKAPAKEYAFEERDYLLKNGISTHIVEGGRVKTERLVTMYSKDVSFRDLNKKQILSFLRYDFVKFLKSIFPRHALSNDETQASGEVATPKSARDLAIARHLRWKQEKYVQDPKGEFKNEVRVEIDGGETLKFHLPVQLMGQLRRTVTTIAFTP